ncbi:MAG: hypothetical protein O7F12_06250 [Nitrospirae bacterium]|nr:hypothetical protein [Nitrospirota bacterium]
MREQRWESQDSLQFSDILALIQKLRSLGLYPADPEKEGICYIEEFEVSSVEDIHHLDFLPTEDLTMVHVLEEWQGDFFLLAGRYHSIFQQYQSVNTYCSISHPWALTGHQATLHPLAMFWIGFRHTHSFIRVRLHTTEVIAPHETCPAPQYPIWIDEREQAFHTAIDILNVPITIFSNNGMVALQTTTPDVPFFCSWPDAFGPCQFEYNSSDPFAFLVPASQLAATHGNHPANLRIYLTGFPLTALKDFEGIQEDKRTLYRCSAHSTLEEVPEIQKILGVKGRLYMSLCEFQTHELMPHERDAASIIGIISLQGELKVEVRFNFMPLPANQMDQWLHDVLGIPMTYSPLSPFP